MLSISISSDNPFQTLITEAENDPSRLQSRYEAHRATRNAQQSAQILAEDFPGWTLDEILMRLHRPKKDDSFVDPRNCLVVWAKPPPQVRDLIGFIQSELQQVAPTLWLMPSENLHATVLEIAHSLTEDQIADLVSTLQLSTEISPAEIANYPLTHRSRLIRPMVSFDASAMALSFVPAAGEPSASNVCPDDDHYSYHHLRRDVWEMVRKAGIPVASRYVVPSAHLTIARFITQDGFLETDGRSVDRGQVAALVEKIDEINQKLQAKYWPRDDGTLPAGGEWLVGQEKGLVIQRGRLWYGDGESIRTQHT